MMDRRALVGAGLLAALWPAAAVARPRDDERHPRLGLTHGACRFEPGGYLRPYNGNGLAIGGRLYEVPWCTAAAATLRIDRTRLRKGELTLIFAGREHGRTILEPVPWAPGRHAPDHRTGVEVIARGWWPTGDDLTLVGAVYPNPVDGSFAADGYEMTIVSWFNPLPCYASDGGGDALIVGDTDGDAWVNLWQRQPRGRLGINNPRPPHPDGVPFIVLSRGGDGAYSSSMAGQSIEAGHNGTSAVNMDGGIVSVIPGDATGPCWGSSVAGTSRPSAEIHHFPSDGGTSCAVPEGLHVVVPWAQLWAPRPGEVATCRVVAWMEGIA